MATVNRYNFLRWEDSVADSPLPRGYLRNCFPTAAVVIVPGEQTSFYIGTKDGRSWGALGQINLIDMQGATVQSGVGTLNSDPIDGGASNIYGTINIASVRDGYYRFRITGPGITSNIVRVQNQGYENTTAAFRFRNDRTLFNVYYDHLPTFYQKFRLSVNVVDAQTEHNKEQYREVTTGKIRNLLSTPDRFLKFETYYFSEGDNEATACMIEHDEMLINETPYTFKSGHVIETNVLTPGNKGTFEVWDNAFSEVNKC